nr:ribonuclease H-like domain-containing protein [Tanacetum cinerariifolium]
RLSPPRVNAANPSAVSAAKGNPQQALKDKGVIDSECSRHMTGNISYLSDFEELNGGYVAFGGHERITRTRRLFNIPLGKCTSKILSNNNLKRHESEGGFERAFASLFDQDVQTFRDSMLLNLDQLQKQLDKDEFQDDRSMAAFWFRETLLQHMGNVKKSVAERTRHRRQYDIRVNKRLMQTHASKVDSSKALDADLVVMESNGTESGKQDTSSSSRNYLTHVVDAYIRPVNYQMPFAEV